VYERKIAKEQALEDAEMQFAGKEKFVTSAYKRKLAEREEWVRGEKERDKREKDEDVTKKTAGSFLFAGFGRNVLSGGAEKGEKDDKFDSRRRESKHNRSDDGDYHRGDSSRETERLEHVSRTRGSRDADSHHYAKPMNSDGVSGNTDAAYVVMKNEKTESVPPKTRRQILEERAVKIREAKERYFQRKGLQPSQ
jgi:coiled-coil domain-containing protein 55